MADKPADKNLLPSLLVQNPSPVGGSGQGRIKTRREQVDSIMSVFLQLLPSNYVSQVQGPFYTIQFQAAAEAIADFQITAQEAFADSDYDYVRGEFLFQLLGSLVFPDATTDGFPTLKGDLTYREFLKRMVQLLLQGATKSTIEGGLELLSAATFTVIEKALAARSTTKKVWNVTTGRWEIQPGSAWGLDDQFEFEINVSHTDPDTGLERFPEDPYVLQENVRIVMRALKPAHTLYEYRHLFTEVFGQFFSASSSWDLSSYYYEDFRKFCCGTKQVSGAAGITWTDRTLFSDTTVEFDQISVGADLVVLSGPNSIHIGGLEGTGASTDWRQVGRYRVEDVLAFPVGTDATARAYTTVPGNLSGFATVTGDVIEDADQDWSLAVEGEALTFTTGPNAGTYRLKWVQGNDGGPVGEAAGPGTRVRVALCLLRLDRRMKVATTGQQFTVSVDRLGVQEPHQVTGEDASLFFVEDGGGVLTRDRLLTQRGPLVKNWGDATPATKQDVTVWVDGLEVTVASVNPYIGEIVLAVPLALTPPGTVEVLVDYVWFKSPIMEMAGLNTPGLVLNKFDCRHGHHDPAAHGDTVQTLPAFPKGAVDTSRFPMNIVLGPIERVKPLYIGHRYLGFERAYSALINSPTTLLLNQAPGRVSVPGFERFVGGVNAAYEGLVKPVVAVPAWALDGTDYGGVDHDSDTGLDLGTYTIIDPLLGEVPSTSATTYHRGLDLTYPSSINLVARFQVDSVLFDSGHPNPGGLPDTPTTEGVFTGVGFGLHDNRYLYFCGILRVNGVEHVGLLLNPKRLHEWSAWDIGPRAILTASSQTMGAFPTVQVPTGFIVGSRFQRMEGTQIGVYTATSVTAQSNGTTTVEFTPALPSPWDTFGNKYTEMVFETRASTKPFTYRIDLDNSQQLAELRISGETAGVVATIDGNVPALPPASQTTLLLPREIVGQVFWGSLSRQATSRATWSFLRYGLIPDQVFLKGHSVSVNTEMAVLPDDNSTADGGAWWPSTMFGDTTVDAGSLLLKATSTDDAVLMGLGYTRVEPFFAPDSILDLQATFHIDTATDGSGCVGIDLDDTNRVVRVRALLVRENFSADPTLYRSLVTLPQVSMAGLVPPEQMDWAAETGSTLTGLHEGAQFVTQQDEDNRGRWEAFLTWGAGGETIIQEDEGRILEAKLEVVAVTPNVAGDTGIVFGCQMVGTTSPYAVVQVEIGGTSGNEEVRLRTASGAVVQAYPFDWTGEVHTYRVLADRVLDTVTLVIDDVVQAPAVAFTLFTGGVNNTQAFFGCSGRDLANLYDPNLTASVEWHYVHVHAQAPADLVRTLGVVRGISEPLDLTDINNYELPRTDVTTAPNSWATGPAIEWWDWRSDIELQAYRDPTWGVTILRPDIPLVPGVDPPWYSAGDSDIGPSAGWINVEYRDLPRSPGNNLGLITWGSINSQNLSQSRWDWVRYQLFKHPTEDRIAPEHMVLNQFNVIASGELGQDRALETVIIQTMDTTRLSLMPTHLYAKSVYKVIDGSTIWTSDYWKFDPLAQLLTLQPDPLTGAVREFSAEHANVTVMFLPGKPVTNTYLALQPLLDGVTLLNEGTPPIPKSQVGNAVATVVDGVLTYSDVAGTHYEDLEFIEVTNGGSPGLLAAICEGGPGLGFSGLATDEGEDIYSLTGTGDPLGGAGFMANHFATGDKVGRAVGAEVFAFEGTQFWQKVVTPKDASYDPSGGLLFASGGSYGLGGGTLGPGSAHLYPSKRRLIPGQGVEQQANINLKLSGVTSGGIEVPLVEDNSGAMSDKLSDFYLAYPVIPDPISPDFGLAPVEVHIPVAIIPGPISPDFGLASPTVDAVYPDFFVAPSFNGSSSAMAPDGSGGYYVGGAFTSVTDSVGTYARNRVCHLDSNGLVTAWDPNCDQNVYCVYVGVDGVYVGGRYTTIGGAARSNIARLDPVTGLADSWDPGTDSFGVNSVAEDGNGIYLGGFFANAGGAARNYIARIDPVTGLADAWNPNASQTVSHIVVDAAGIYTVGSFTTIGGASRSRIARLSPTTGLADGWNPNSSYSTRRIIVDPAGIYVIGDFAAIGAVFRNRVARIDAVTGLADSWDPDADATPLHLVPDAAGVYISGYCHTFGGVTTRNRIARLDPITGAPDAWDPDCGYTSTYAQKVECFVVRPGSGRVVIGGTFSAVTNNKLSGGTNFAVLSP